MRTTLAFMCAVLMGACAWGEGSPKGGDDDDMPTPDAPAAVCGDGTCSASEVGNCTADCGSQTTPVCGNGTCEPPSETTTNCAMDCHAAGPICGDAVCDMAGGENSTNCPGDCTGGGGTLDCADPLVLISCLLCTQDATQCAALGVDAASCAACTGP